jgi:hypothetical protein
LVILVAAAACEDGGASTPGGAGSGSAGSAVAAAPVKNPGGGFSADLAKKLDTAGSASDTPERTAGGTPEEPKVAAGSGSAEMKGSADAKAGSADVKAGSAVEPPKPADVKAGSAGSAVAKVEPPKPPDVKAGSAVAKVEPPKPPDVKAGSAVAKVEPTKPTDTKPAETKTGSASGTAPKIDGMSTTPSKSPVSTPAELKAINISLLPNWERDVAAPGTISLAVKIPGKTDIVTFQFSYGMEDPKAPADRDAYKKWLATNKIFVSKDDRQKGAAWYLEGVDGAGKPAFRMVVIYGGKKLICFGSLYKDSGLGDLRDQTVIQAKQICETLTL